MGKNRRIKRPEGDQETLCGDSSSPPGEQRPAQIETKGHEFGLHLVSKERTSETGEEGEDTNTDTEPYWSFHGHSRTPVAVHLDV
ncbi:unnamed protein product [Arctogadus glacialis]